MKDKGTVKTWISDRGFGFLTDDFDDRTDIFFHVSALPPIDRLVVEEGQRFQYETQNGRDGRMQAVRMERIEE